METVSEHIANTFSVDHAKLRQSQKHYELERWQFIKGIFHPVVHVTVDTDLIVMESFGASFWSNSNPELFQKKELMSLTKDAVGFSDHLSNYENPDKGPFWFARESRNIKDFFVVFNSFKEAQAYISALISEYRTLFDYKNWEESSVNTLTCNTTYLQPSKVTSEHLKEAFDLGLIELKNDHWVVESEFGQ